MDSITANFKCNNVYSNTEISPYFLIGAGNYITMNYNDNYIKKEDEERYSSPDLVKDNAVLYYPNACLFCGVPNGSLKQKEDKKLCIKEEQLITITAAPIITTPALDYSKANQNLPSLNPLLTLTINKQPYSQNYVVHKLTCAIKRAHFLFEYTRKFIIRKRLHFPVVAHNRKRTVIPSSFY
ncbi:uncharacterized protein BX663DRAFT_514508 [Cokeromyces recurvatus]|uniref:uncharacterized protein n=1 Tax=Cokeromyces recurvatus TaxID=90255 RepID=UPI002220D8C3|nr:uncharacterized protein BX663DRAFT_514508 [Cokeromyces recurvatus]KAI7901463.1 hypothetical protein BX663DRAFT_514508 [Cokeromyces recurvatus]